MCPAAAAAAAVATACQSQRPSAVAAADTLAGGRQSSHSACAADVGAAESQCRWFVPKQQETASHWTWAECIRHAEADACLQQ